MMGLTERLLNEANAHGPPTDDLLTKAAFRIEHLRAALTIAMAYMPHGTRYEGPSDLRADDMVDWQVCHAALQEQETT